MLANADLGNARVEMNKHPFPQHADSDDARPERDRVTRTSRSRLRVPRELWVAAVLSLLAVAVNVVVAALGIASSEHQHLGAEYYNVARALVDGRGFSDPFAEPTGPTAWMPPLYPALLAGLLSLLGKKSLLAGSIVLLMNIAVVSIGTTIYAIARRCQTRLSPSWAVGFYALWVLSFYYWFFLLTSDIWALALLVSAMTWATFDYVTRGTARPWVWGLVGGFGVLTSPAIGIAWGCLCGIFFLRWKPHRREWLMAGALAALIAAPWTIRNAVVFQRFIPVKSNLAFEAYQANVVDRDGIYDVGTMMLHPYNVPDMRFDYALLGETAYVAKHGAKFRQALQAEPGKFLRRVGNRMLAATVVYHPLTSSHDFPVERAIKNVLYPLPFVLCLVGLWVRSPHRRLLLFLAFFCTIYLAPYVVVAFYVRYFLPLTPILVLTSFLGADALARRWLERPPLPPLDEAS